MPQPHWELADRLLMQLISAWSWHAPVSTSKVPAVFTTLLMLLPKTASSFARFKHVSNYEITKSCQIHLLECSLVSLPLFLVPVELKFIIHPGKGTQRWPLSLRQKIPLLFSGRLILVSYKEFVSRMVEDDPPRKQGWFWHFPHFPSINKQIHEQNCLFLWVHLLVLIFTLA